MNKQACLMPSVWCFLLVVTANVPPVEAAVQVTSTEIQSSLHPTFDVVSIRPLKEDDNTPTHITNSPHSGYITAQNVNLKALLEVAYDIPDIRMFGGPAWLVTAKFSLEAKSDPKTEEQIASLTSDEGKQIKRKMLAALLNDRFKVSVHTETKDMPVYALVVSKGGPRPGRSIVSNDPSPTGSDRIDVRAGSNSIEVLAYELSWRLGRPVLDRTGLQDRQALTLRWQEDEATAADSTGPSLSTAMQEQLGLKLKATTGLVPILVIDHAEELTEN